MNVRSAWGNPFKKEAALDENDVNFLSDIPIFDTLTRRQKTKIQSIIHTRNYSKGEIVFRKQDPGVGLYIVREGQVEVYNEYSDMTKSLVATLNKGEFFGEISLLNDVPRSGTVVASQNSILFGLFRTDLLVMMDSDPKLGVRLVYRLAQVIAERLRIANEDTED